MQTLMQKYARVLVEYSLKIRKGDKVLVTSTYQAEPLIKEFYRQALQAGANVEFRVGLNGTERIFYENASKEQLGYISPTSKYIYENYDAILNIAAPFNKKELQSIDPTKKQTVSIARTELNKTFMKRSAADELRWTLCAYPTSSAAQESDMSLDEYEQFVYSACFLDKQDPVAEWQQLAERQQKAVDMLNTKTKIRYVSADLDVTFSTKDRIWLNSAGTHNMPSGEVFTTPVEDSVNGTIRFSYPCFYMGQMVEDVRLEVKDGLVVKWDAAEGKEFLDKIFEIEGTRRFGEAAVGMNHGIKKFTKSILFDEKIGGTIHMAIGAAYPETGGKNESSVHWDMIADMTQNGQIYADDELVYENGHFIL
jgi:aminopeptidase